MPGKPTDELTSWLDFGDGFPAQPEASRHSDRPNRRREASSADALPAPAGDVSGARGSVGVPPVGVPIDALGIVEPAKKASGAAGDVPTPSPPPPIAPSAEVAPPTDWTRPHVGEGRSLHDEFEILKAGGLAAMSADSLSSLIAELEDCLAAARRTQRARAGGLAAAKKRKPKRTDQEVVEVYRQGGGKRYGALADAAKALRISPRQVSRILLKTGELPQPN